MSPLKARYLLWSVLFWPFVVHFWQRFKPKTSTSEASTQTDATSSVVDNATQTSLVDNATSSVATQAGEGINDFIIVEYCPRV